MKRSYEFIGLVSFVFFSLSICEAQNASSFDRVPVSERIYFGGGGSFRTGVNQAYGYRYNYIALSPMIGFMLSPKFSVGSFVNFQHYGYPDQGFSNNQYGVSPFAQYRISKIFAYAEYSVLSVPTIDNVSRKIYTRLPIGLGYSMPLGGGKASINVMALYDIKYNRTTSPFFSPWIIRVFISAGKISF